MKCAQISFFLPFNFTSSEKQGNAPNFDFCRLISQVVRSREMRPNFVFLPFNFTSSEKLRNVLNFDFCRLILQAVRSSEMCSISIFAV